MADGQMKPGQRLSREGKILGVISVYQPIRGNFVKSYREAVKFGLKTLVKLKAQGGSQAIKGKLKRKAKP